MSERDQNQVPTKVMITGVYRLFCEALAERLNKVEGFEVTAVCEDDLAVAYRRIVDKRVRELLREFGVRQRPAAVAVARERQWI